MKNLLRKHSKLQWLACCALACCFASCSDDEGNKVSTYDPSKPLVLTDFYPKEGVLSDQVILNGENFGNNKDDVKVYFNDKEAPIISVKGDKMLVLAPKRASTVEDPACVIKVQVQEQEEEYAETFDYYIQTTVTTLVGGTTSASTNPTGTVSLSEAQFRSSIDRVICVDADKNVFFLVDNDGKFAAFMANEAAGQLICLKEDVNSLFDSPFLAYNPNTNRVYRFNGQLGGKDLTYFDPLSDYGYTSEGSFEMDSSESLFSRITGFGVWTAKSNFTMGPDGYFYCRMLNGYLMRLNMNTFIGEKLEPADGSDEVGGTNGTSYGLVFDPNDDNVFYFSVTDQHCIFKFDLTTMLCTAWAGEQGVSGYLDGPRGQARFDQPCQLVFDSEGNMVVADKNNHCIRKITMSTGYVSTLAGTPRSSGYANGTAEDAKFNQPLGLCIDSDDVMYIGDSQNRAIRRLAIE